MRQELEDRIELETAERIDAAVVWLHGLGADGNDFAELVPYLALPPTAGIRFVFPHAPMMPITINGGMVMRGWYDIRALPIDVDPDTRNIRDSAQRVRGLIERENQRGVPSARILLAGFSQGGAIALHAGLRHDQPLAGVIALSACLHMADEAAAERHPANRQTPFFLSHGSQDDVVPIALGRAAADRLRELEYAVEWSEYPMGHSVHPEQIRVLRDWMLERLYPA